MALSTGLLRLRFVASNSTKVPFATPRCRIGLNTNPRPHNATVLHICRCAADNPVAETAPKQQEPRRSNDKRGTDRKQPRKSAPTGPTVVVQTAEAASAGALPDVLAATWPATFPTLSAARRVIRKDLVLVDGAVGSCKTEVCVGQVLQQLEAVAKHKGPRVVSLEVVYEDDSLAVVHKPWGVKMYGGDGRRTITGALRAGALNPSPNPDALPEPKPVHRLDAAVGGLLVIAKTTSALVSLSAQWQDRRVHKVYHALLSGRLNPKAAAAQLELSQQQQQGSGESSPDQSEDQPEEDDVMASQEEQQQQQQPDLPLPELLQLQLQGRPAFTTAAADVGDACLLEPPAAAPAADGSSNGSSSSSSGSSGGSSSALSLGPGVYVIDAPLEGKPCYTLYQVLGYSRAGRFGGWMTSIALSPVTGRKHQLRQHMAAAGHPIVGDGKYTNDKADHISNQGIYLESLEVSFSHPVSQQLLHITTPELQRFATLREQQHRRWHKLEAATAKEAAEGAAAAGNDGAAAAARDLAAAVAAVAEEPAA